MIHKVYFMIHYYLLWIHNYYQFQDSLKNFIIHKIKIVCHKFQPFFSLYFMKNFMIHKIENCI